MDRRALWATVHGVGKSQTWLSNWVRTWWRPMGLTQLAIYPEVCINVDILARDQWLGLGWRLGLENRKRLAFGKHYWEKRSALAKMSCTLSPDVLVVSSLFPKAFSGCVHSKPSSGWSNISPQTAGWFLLLPRWWSLRAQCIPPVWGESLQAPRRSKLLTGQAKQEREWTAWSDSMEVAGVLEKDFLGSRRRKLHGSGFKRRWKGSRDIGYWIFPIVVSGHNTQHAGS